MKKEIEKQKNSLPSPLGIETLKVFMFIEEKEKRNGERILETYSQHMHIHGKGRDCSKN